MNQTDWRLKYQALQDTQRNYQVATEKTIHQLLRDLSRVSLSGNGIDKTLDIQLDDLRREIRARADPEQVHALSEKIANTLRDLDAEHQDRQLLVLQNIQNFLKALTNVRLSRRIRKDANQLTKDIKQYKAGDDPHEILVTYAALLEKIFTFLDQKAKQLPTSKGFFANLFTKKVSSEKITNKEELSPDALIEETNEADMHVGKSTQADDELVSLSTSTITDDNSAPKANQTRARDRQQQEKIGMELTETLEYTPPVNSENTFVPPPELIHILKRLLDTLILPKEYLDNKNALYEQLGQSLAMDDLTGFISEITHLLSIALAGEKGRHEEFLSHLNKRLNEVNLFLTHTQSSEATHAKAGDALEAAVKKDVYGIRDSLEKETTLEALQESIDIRLQHIVQVLDEFKQDRQDRLENALKTIDAMQDKLSETEQTTKNLQNALQKERGAANIDTLTGISNRKAYDEYLASCYESWFNEHDALTLIIADIDHFKRINDTFGHSAGDAVLRIMGSILKNNVRKTDFVARYGGEEFVVVLRGVDLEFAQQIAENLRKIVSEWKFTYQSKDVEVTLSLGIASFAENDDDHSVFQRADKALYLAKQLGRNQIKTELDIK